MSEAKVMTDILIEIEDENIITKNKKGKPGETYSIQEAYFHSVDRDGYPERYPTKINVFPRKDHQGNPIPYKKGQYKLAPQSFQVERGFLQMAFPALVPTKAIV